ncbi:MAG TPA: hypothetical protein VGQ83_06450 [Polyangia bacterium]|jgi:hypothetical protein
MRSFLILTLGGLLLGSSIATADTADDARAPGAAAPAAETAPKGEALPAALPSPPPRQIDRRPPGGFSAGRLVVEMLVGVAVGSAAVYGTYKAMCSGTDCFGPALAGLGASMVVTPLAVWGAGELMGGDGSLAWTYVGGLGMFSASSTSNPMLVIEIGTIAMPVLAPLFYELSSHSRARGKMVSGLRPRAALLVSNGGVGGGVFGMSGQF